MKITYSLNHIFLKNAVKDFLYEGGKISDIGISYATHQKIKEEKAGLSTMLKVANATQIPPEKFFLAKY